MNTKAAFLNLEIEAGLAVEGGSFMKLSGVAHRIAVFSSVLLGFQIMLGTISVQTGEAKLTGRNGWI